MAKELSIPPKAGAIPAAPPLSPQTLAEQAAGRQAVEIAAEMHARRMAIEEAEAKAKAEAEAAAGGDPNAPSSFQTTVSNS